ncbi:unnamed protein product [Protopolystoma xenopodis]|uniref:Uncharacterized protein n=1 Tax=Protopolystoma xenopodis TaxID=117903 RepID=A0A448WET5_9PLAT|nr:unnamed protein product [Protopolystoma xenopodis]
MWINTNPTRFTEPCSPQFIICINCQLNGTGYAIGVEALRRTEAENPTKVGQFIGFNRSTFACSFRFHRELSIKPATSAWSTHSCKHHGSFSRLNLSKALKNPLSASWLQKTKGPGNENAAAIIKFKGHFAGPRQDTSSSTHFGSGPCETHTSRETVKSGKEASAELTRDRETWIDEHGRVCTRERLCRVAYQRGVYELAGLYRYLIAKNAESQDSATQCRTPSSKTPSEVTRIKGEIVFTFSTSVLKMKYSMGLSNCLRSKFSNYLQNYLLRDK